MKILNKIIAVITLVLLLPLALSAKPSYPVFGYFPNYAVSGPYPADGSINMNDNVKFPWARLTHVMDAFGHPTAGGAITFPNGQRGGSLVLKAHQNNTRAMLSIGGAGVNLSYWQGAAGPARTTFVNNIMWQMDNIGYDGVDIDWEFPGSGDMNNFTLLMNALYTAIKTRNSNCGGCVFQGEAKQLTFFGSPGYDICGVDWDNVVGAGGTDSWNVDYCILGGYDFNSGPGYNGPIDYTGSYTNCAGIGGIENSVSGTLDFLTGIIGQKKAFPINKIILALPMYTAQSSPGFSPQTPAMVPLRSGSFVSYDGALTREARYSYSGQTHYVTNEQAFCDKMNWALLQGIQGFALWEISHMYPQNHSSVANIWEVIEGNGGSIGCVLPPPSNPPPPPVSVPAGMIDIGTGSSTDLWGGTWTVAADVGASLTPNFTAAGYAPSPYNTSGPNAIGATGSNTGWGSSLSAALSAGATPVDVSTYNRIDFWFKAPAGVYRFELDRSATRLTGNNHYGQDFVVSAGEANTWVLKSYYFINLTQSFGTPVAKAWTDVIAVVFTSKAVGAFSFNLDDIELVTDALTPTYTPVPPPNLLDTVEDGNNITIWGGQWATYNPAGAGDTIAMNTFGSGYPFSSYGYQYSVESCGTNGADASPPQVSVILGTTGWVPAWPNYSMVDLSAWNTLHFFAKATGQSNYTVQMGSGSGGFFTRSLVIPTDGNWHEIVLPIGNGNGWNYSWGGNGVDDGTFANDDATTFTWFPEGPGAFCLALDDLEFELRPDTPTPSATATPTHTPTSSHSPTLTASPTPTHSPTLTHTPTHSPTSTWTPTVSPTFTDVVVGSTSTWTPTDTSTYTHTPTFTSTYTVTPTHSPTVTNTYTYTDTPTITATPTNTLTVTRTSTPNWTATPTWTPGACAFILPFANAKLFDDMELGLAGMYKYGDGVSSITFTASTADSNSGLQSMLIEVTTDVGSWGAGGGISSNYGDTGPFTHLDVTGAISIRMAVQTDSDIGFYVTLAETGAVAPEVETWTSPRVDLVADDPVPGCWQEVRILLSGFTENINNGACAPLPGGCLANGNNTLDLDAIIGFDIQFIALAGTVGANVYLDDIEFELPGPPATDTPTNTETPVPPTDTYTATETPVVPTDTYTATETPVPATFTYTPTPTITLTDTPVPVGSTFTWTPTHSPTVTSTLTYSYTSTVTMTLTPTPSFTATYTPAGLPPVLVSLNPVQGSITGGETVTLTGTNFQPDARVWVDGSLVPAVSVTWISATQILVSAMPAHAAGLVNVAVENPTVGSGTSTLVNAYTYLSNLIPDLISLNLVEGSINGGQVVTLAGDNFNPDAVVWVDGTALSAASVVWISKNSLEVTMPAHVEGLVGVSVENPSVGSDDLPGAYTYVGPVNASGPNQVLEALPGQNPVSGSKPVSIYVTVAGPVDAIKVQLFTTSMLKIFEVEWPVAQSRAGIVEVPLNGALDILSNGIYYYVVTSQRGSDGSSEPVVNKLVILR